MKITRKLEATKTEKTNVWQITMSQIKSLLHKLLEIVNRKERHEEIYYLKNI